MPKSPHVRGEQQAVYVTINKPLPASVEQGTPVGAHLVIVEPGVAHLPSAHARLEQHAVYVVAGSPPCAASREEQGSPALWTQLVAVETTGAGLVHVPAEHVVGAQQSVKVVAGFAPALCKDVQGLPWFCTHVVAVVNAKGVGVGFGVGVGVGGGVGVI